MKKKLVENTKVGKLHKTGWMKVSLYNWEITP